MPKRARELGPLQLKRITKPGAHAVGGVSGLMLRVKDTGAKSWILRATVGTRRRSIGLGPYPEIPLAQARERAREARDQIRQGVDPIAARRAARDALIAADGKRITFDQAAAQFLARKTREFRNGKHAAQWRSTLAEYASPVIGRVPVDQVELAHVVKILEPLWTTKTETGVRVRGRVEAVLAYATASGFRDGDNPARWRGNLDAILPKPRKLAKVTHHRALPIDAVPEFMVELRRRQGIAARALEFVVLTAARSGEVRLATWYEVDLEARTWTVPAARMKAGREHVVPLAPPAVALLKALPRHEGSPYVFAAPRGGPLSDMALSAVTRRMAVDAVPHGFRSTFRDWCSERTSYPREVAEMALAHTIPSAVERAYRRGDLLAKRTRLMREWARYLAAPAKRADVVPVRARR